MRILFLSQYALPHLDGISSAVDGLSRELARRGHEVVHVASDAGLEEAAEQGGAVAASAGAGAPRVVHVPATNFLENLLEVPYPLFSPQLLAVLRREIAAADVVHGHGFLFMSSVGGLWWARLRQACGRRAPLRVLTEHVGHVPYSNPILDLFEAATVASVGRLCALSSEAIVTLNDRVSGEMAAIAPGRPALRIPNGIDVDRYRPPEPGEREALRGRLGWDARPRVLFVGRLVAKKGLDVALAAAAAAEGAFELVVVGPGRPGPLPPEASYLGPMPKERVAELYRAADAFLLPSRAEGFPVTVQEAMASGLPAVVSGDESYAPYRDGAGEGLTLVAPQATAITAVLRGLFSSPTVLAAAGEAARAHAVGSFSWPRAAQEHERLYEELRSQKGFVQPSRPSRPAR